MLRRRLNPVLPELRDGEVLDCFCTEGQGLYPFQHILGRQPTRARKKTKLQPRRREKGIGWRTWRLMDKSHSAWRWRHSSPSAQDRTTCWTNQTQRSESFQRAKTTLIGITICFTYAFNIHISIALVLWYCNQGWVLNFLLRYYQVSENALSFGITFQYLRSKSHQRLRVNKDAVRRSQYLTEMHQFFLTTICQSAIRWHSAMAFVYPWM